MGGGKKAQKINFYRSTAIQRAILLKFLLQEIKGLLRTILQTIVPTELV